MAQSYSEKELEKLKVPPHSLEAEQSVLGGLMLDNEIWDRVSDKITDHDFYRNDHKLIFAAISHLLNNGEPCDAVTLESELNQRGVLNDVGGFAKLAELANNTVSVANVCAYADIVHEKSILRELLGAARDVADKVYSPKGESVATILDEAERKVFAIAEHGQREVGPEAMQDILPTVVSKLDELKSHDGGVTGTATHFTDLDQMLSGLQPADLLIVAGRPSMGKTTFAINIAENVAMDYDKPVLVFSLEMPKDSIVMRVLSSLSSVNQSNLRSGQLKDHDWEKLFSTMAIINDRMNLYIDDTAALSPAEIRSRARRLAREKGGLSLIVVDYLQLMQIPGSHESRTQEVSEISRNLKALAKELNVPVIALSQLSRKCEERPNKRPLMSDLRESGAIEQDADVIMFVYRDEVYNPDSEDKGTAEIKIGKHRNGPIGTVRLSFQGQWSCFKNYAPEAIPMGGFTS